VTTEAEHPVPAVQLTVGPLGIDDSGELAHRRLDPLDVFAASTGGLEVFRFFGRVLRDVGGDCRVRERPKSSDSLDSPRFP
jgi:hypothetical protein